MSDFSQVIQGTANTLAAVIRNRLESFINGKYGLDKKVAEFINKVLKMIPD